MKTSGGFLISQIHKLSGRAGEKILKEKGIEAFTGAQGRILYVLWEMGSLPISEIGNLTSLANTTLTSMLDYMENSGLVRRTPNPADRRQVIISLTPKAEGLKEDYDEVSEKCSQVFYAGFTEDEIVGFENTLRRILANLQKGRFCAKNFRTDF